MLVDIEGRKCYSHPDHFHFWIQYFREAMVKAFKRKVNLDFRWYKLEKYLHYHILHVLCTKRRIRRPSGFFHSRIYRYHFQSLLSAFPNLQIKWLLLLLCQGWNVLYCVLLLCCVITKKVEMALLNLFSHDTIFSSSEATAQHHHHLVIFIPLLE